jgi:organic radical activating enzyme
MNKWSQDRTQYKKELDAVSPSFCLAKWTQTTIHLGLGHTHSCHHPRTHVIPISEIKKSPSALHNTEFKKAIRQQMIDGDRPTECNYCWKVEDSGNHLSDRILKSYESWSRPYIDTVLQTGSTENINPKYLEVSFSNVCNFKCSYCSPDVSSQWMEEIKQHGPYPTSIQYNNLDWIKQQNKIPIPEKEFNPYVEAFWEWWPDLYSDLHTFRITGGEPLLSKHTFKVLDYIIENPNSNLELGINSNFCVPDELFDKFLLKLKKIKENKSVKELTIFTSCEAHGSAAEYIRHGLDYNKWLANCEKYLSNIDDPKLVVMSTYNALSVTTYDKFLNDIILLNLKYGRPTWYNQIINKLFKIEVGTHPVMLDIPYLNNPQHQSVGILTNDFIDIIKKQTILMNSLSIKNKDNSYGFYKSEVQKLERLLSVFESTVDNSMWIQHRKDFVIFVDEHDKRRGTNFLSTFPEMTDFYNLCKTY